MITVTALGANSATLTYDNTTTLLELIQEVEDYITTHGWALWDINAGTNARAYRALNYDGETYKYIVIDYNTSGYLIVRVYETWDADAHTGTNQALFDYAYKDWKFFNGENEDFNIQTPGESLLSQKIAIGTGSTLHIYCTARYLILQSAAGTEYLNSACFTAVCEYARDNAEDIPSAGIPPFGLLCSWNLQSGAAAGTDSLNNGNAAGYLFAFCRLVNNGTGLDAVKRSWLSFPEMHYCTQKSEIVFLSNNRIRGCSVYDPILSTTNYWSGKKLASNIFVGYSGGRGVASLYIPNGRVFGLKIISSNQGAINDVAKIECDGDNFHAIGGTLVNHRILPGRAWGVMFPGYQVSFAIPE